MKAVCVLICSLWHQSLEKRCSFIEGLFSMWAVAYRCCMLYKADQRCSCPPGPVCSLGIQLYGYGLPLIRFSYSLTPHSLISLLGLFLWQQSRQIGCLLGEPGTFMCHRPPRSLFVFIFVFWQFNISSLPNKSKLLSLPDKTHEIDAFILYSLKIYFSPQLLFARPPNYKCRLIVFCVKAN